MNVRLTTRRTVAGGLLLVGIGVTASALAWSSLPEEMVVR